MTIDEIKALTEYQKEVFVTKDEFSALRSDVRELIISVDNYSRRADTYFQEMVMMSQKVSRLERWIEQIAKKVDIKLEY